MKQITLNFREVAVDGLPEKSMDVLVASFDERGHMYGVMEVPYSAKHEQFNNYDYRRKDDPPCFSDVKYWVPTNELREQLNGGETP